MNKKNCHEAFDIYKMFISQTTKVSEFLKVAEVFQIEPLIITLFDILCQKFYVHLSTQNPSLNESEEWEWLIKSGSKLRVNYIVTEVWSCARDQLA